MDQAKLRVHKLREIKMELESFKKEFGHLCPKSIHLIENDIKVYTDRIIIEENQQKLSEISMFPHFPVE